MRTLSCGALLLLLLLGCDGDRQVYGQAEAVPSSTFPDFTPDGSSSASIFVATEGVGLAEDQVQLSFYAKGIQRPRSVSFYLEVNGSPDAGWPQLVSSENGLSCGNPVRVSGDTDEYPGRWLISRGNNGRDCECAPPPHGRVRLASVVLKVPKPGRWRVHLRLYPDTGAATCDCEDGCASDLFGGWITDRPAAP